jgi:polar amino acid transport system permease protein
VWKRWTTIEQLLAVGKSLPMLLRATVINLEVLAALLAVGFVVGTFVAVLQVYGGRLVGYLAFVFEWVFRSIPALVLLLLFYFGPPRFGIEISSFLAATLALGFRSAAYQSQIFRGAIQAIPASQMLAARSVGMSRGRAVASIILPQAFRLSIPGWSNEFSGVTKDTTLAYAVGLNEVLRAARIIMDRQYNLAMLAFLSVALVFLVLTYTGNWGLGLLEKKTRIPGLEMKRVGGQNR